MSHARTKVLDGEVAAPTGPSSVDCPELVGAVLIQREVSSFTRASTRTFYNYWDYAGVKKRNKMLVL
jgi:hypothetical protein